MPDQDLAAELDRLDKASDTWEYESDTARITCDYGNGGYQVATSVGETDGLLIVWLRNHTDEIKAALEAKVLWDTHGSEEIKAALAERDRLREEVALLSEQKPGRSRLVVALEDARAENARLQRAVDTLNRTTDELADDVNRLAAERDDLRTERDRLKRALAGHLFDGESLSTREAIRSELIKQGFEDAEETDRLRTTVQRVEALTTTYAAIHNRLHGQVEINHREDQREIRDFARRVHDELRAALAGDDGGDHR